MAIAVSSLAAIEPIEIIRKIDKNEVYESIKYEGEMIIVLSGKRIVKTFYAYQQGNDNSFMEFTNPDDEGTKYLKKDGNLYVYTADLEEIMPITGHMLKESMMGSDMSYEDTIDNDTLESQYNGRVIEETTLEGKKVWVLELTAKKKTVSYAKRLMWVDQETFSVLKEEVFALSGVKLRVTTLKNYKKFGDKYFPVNIEVDDLLRKNSTTQFIMTNVELNVTLPKGIFSMRNLER